jgi:hypothetical protein
LIQIDNRHSAIDNLTAPLPAFNHPRSYPFKENPKLTKFFYNPLTPYFTISYLFSVLSVSSAANVFLNPNAHLRPIMGRYYVPILSELKFNENKNLSAAPFGGNP